MGAALGCSCETGQDQAEVSLIQPVNKESNRGRYNADNNGEIDSSQQASPDENMRGREDQSSLDLNNTTNQQMMQSNNNNPNQSSVLINQSPEGLKSVDLQQVVEDIKIAEALDLTHQQPQTQIPQLEQVVDAIEKQLSRHSSQPEHPDIVTFQPDLNLKESPNRQQLECHEQLVNPITQQIDADEEAAPEKDDEGAAPQKNEDQKEGEDWQNKFWDQYEGEAEKKEQEVPVKVSAEEVQPRLIEYQEVNVEQQQQEEENKVEVVSAVQVEPINNSAQKVVEQVPQKSSAQKGRRNLGGTKTPGHPQLHSSSDNAFGQVRRSAAALVGQRKISATPAAHQQLLTSQTGTLQRTSLQKHQQASNLANNRARTSMKKDDANGMNTSITAKPRRRLSAGKSKLPASLTPQMQSLNRTQQFLSTHQPKKQHLAATTELPNYNPIQLNGQEEAKREDGKHIDELHNPVLTAEEQQQESASDDVHNENDHQAEDEHHQIEHEDDIEVELDHHDHHDHLGHQQDIVEEAAQENEDDDEAEGQEQPPQALAFEIEHEEQKSEFQTQEKPQDPQVQIQVQEGEEVKVEAQQIEETKSLEKELPQEEEVKRVVEEEVIKSHNNAPQSVTPPGDLKKPEDSTTGQTNPAEEVSNTQDEYEAAKNIQGPSNQQEESKQSTAANAELNLQETAIPTIQQSAEPTLQVSASIEAPPIQASPNVLRESIGGSSVTSSSKNPSQMSADQAAKKKRKNQKKRDKYKQKKKAAKLGAAQNQEGEEEGKEDNEEDEDEAAVEDAANPGAAQS